MTENLQFTSIRAYETPNLMQMFEATLVEAHPPTSSNNSFDNLLMNYDSRSGRSFFNAIIDEDGNQASYKSCYRAQEDGVSAGPYRVMTVKLDKSFF